MILIDILAILTNAVGWGIKPVLEKISVEKIGYSNFSYIRYIITGIIALPLLIYNIYFNKLADDRPKNPNYFQDSIKWGSIVAVVSLISILANYYLLSKYAVSYIAPIVEGGLLVLNAVFGVIFLKEKLTLQAMIGIATIIAGVFILYSEYW